MIQRNIRDTVLLSGWLFADLLLGLMVIFMASIPGAQPRPPVIPTLVVTPMMLTPSNLACTGGNTKPVCTLTVGESPGSVGPLSWQVSSDISDSLVFSPAGGTLTPGKTEQMTVTLLCQNGSLTFTGSRGATPVVVSWRCVPAPDRLDFHYKQFNVTINDVNVLLNGTPEAVASIENQIRAQPVLQGRHVGLALVYGGAPTVNDAGTGSAIAGKIYSIMQHMASTFEPLKNASYYDTLFLLGASESVAVIQVYLFVQ
jgi:hypothetical protein